jgi:hypothetical protein
LGQEDYELLKKRYSRPLKQVIEAGKIKPESIHKPVLQIEKEKQFLEQKDRQFKGVLDQWDLHLSPEWRAKKFKDAEQWKDKLESVRLVLAKKESAI